MFDSLHQLLLTLSFLSLVLDRVYFWAVELFAASENSVNENKVNGL